MLTEEKNSAGGAIAFFEGGSNKPEVLEAKQWLEAVLYDKEPLVKPDQAFIVTKILDAVYKSAETGKEIVFVEETVLNK
jgi:predicted dehydrogenase